MNLDVCYRELGGKLEDVLKRLPGEAFVKKFLNKFLDDKSYEQLVAAMEARSQEEAFRAAHTLKGICGNLEIKNLGNAVEELTNELRPENNSEITPRADELLGDIKTYYQQAVASIGKLE